MKFCSKCGKEIMEEAVICVHCGCAVKEVASNQSQQPITPLNDPNETNGLAIGAIICAILIPIVGLILGIIGTAKYKTPAYKGQCTGAIFLSIFIWIMGIIIISSLY